MFKAFAAGRASDGSDLMVLDDQGNLTIKGNYSPSSSGSSPIQTATVTLSAAQIKTLKATPVQLVAAPGVGKAIIFHFGHILYVFNTAPYASISFQAQLGIGHTLAWNTEANSFFAHNLIDAVENTFLWGGAELTDPTPTASVLDNQPLIVFNTGSSEFTDGDGTLVVTVYYSVVTLA
jgi:hypothetical protein